MDKHFVLSILLCITASVASPLAAQIPDSTARADSAARADSTGRAQRLGAVVVEATRTRQDVTQVPQAVSAIGEDRIQTGQRQVTLDEALQGTCTELCSGPPAEPVCDDPDVSCSVSGDGVLSLCLLPCDPLQQDCAGGQDLCIPVGETFACIMDASGDEGQVFDPCEFANVCDQGLLCLASPSATECDQSASGCCLPFCDLADADLMCPGVGQSCLPFFEAGMAPPKLANVGICAIER